MRTLACLIIIFGFVPMWGQKFLNDSTQTNRDYFPIKSSFGFEITGHLEQGTVGVQGDLSNEVQNNLEFGVNYLFSGWYKGNRTPEQLTGFITHAGLYQFGTSVTVNPVREILFGGTPDDFKLETLPDSLPALWKWNAGLIYNQFSTRLAGFGVSVKVKATTYAYNNTQPGNPLPALGLFDNLDLTPQVGISWMGIINFYYGRTLTLSAFEDVDFIRPDEQRFTITLSLNPSVFKFGLQGL